MQGVIPWLVVALLLASAVPTSLMLLRRSDSPPDWALLTALSTGSALGALTLVMFAASLAGVPFDAVLLTLATLAIFTPGVIVWLRAGRPVPPLPQWTGWHALALGVLALVCVAVFFNAAYWPFSRDDALGIYHAQAVQLAETRALVPLTGADSLYLTYAPLIPLAYAYSYLLAGWEHEYLARGIATLLALGCLPATYALGREISSRSTGLLAALLLALTPTFGRWASAGYVDLPAAFFITLSAIFALRLWRSGRLADALVCGASIGLAAWTKNAALIEVVVLGFWLLAGIVMRRFNLRAFGAALLACGLIAGPWYARNWFGAGFLIPDTAWTEQARPTLDSLLLFITKPEIYGVIGWLLLGGVIYGLQAFARGHKRSESALLLLWTAPFFGAWWLLTSYDPRLLLPVVPVFAVMGGWLLATVWRAIPLQHQPLLRGAAIIAMLALAALTIWNSVEHKDEILRNPLMDDATKHEIVLADRNTTTSDE